MYNKKKIANRQSIIEELLLFILLCSQCTKLTLFDASEASENFFKNKSLNLTKSLVKGRLKRNGALKLHAKEKI